jgi:hypothetical protein
MDIFQKNNTVIFHFRYRAVFLFIIYLLDIDFIMFFKKLSKYEVLEKMEQRKIELRKIDKLPSLLDKFYLSFVSKYEGIEITPDIEVFGYEKALCENRYLAANYGNISKKVWIIGTSGQGDEWFINRENNLILFYDHNQGEYSNISQFKCLNISFCSFLQMAFLYQDLEMLLDKQNSIDKPLIDDFINEVNSIHPYLYTTYPYKYF